MKKSIMRVSTAAMAVLMAAGALTACSGGSSSQTTAAATEAEKSSEAAGSEAAKTDSGNGEGVTIRLVHYMGEQAKRDALDAILADFKKENPDINVDIEVVSSSSYIATYKNYIAAGEAPDIMFGKPQNLTEFVEAGYLMDLKDEKCLENVLPMLKDECTVNGGVYGFPIDAQVKACL